MKVVGLELLLGLCLLQGGAGSPVLGRAIHSRAVTLGIPQCLSFVRSVFGGEMPLSAADIDTKFFLYTRDRDGATQIRVGEFKDSADGRWKPLEQLLKKRKTIFVIHGFQNSADEEWVKKMAQALLSTKEDLQVVAVDWAEGAKPRFFNYVQSVSNTPVVGEEVAKLVRHLNEHLGIPLSDFHLIGHSLGAQVASYVSHHLKGKVGRLTALDPACPCFSMLSRDLRVDPEDAEFVDVIHTNGRDKYSLGLMTPVGDVDFYPNGGQEQPACGVKSFWLRPFKLLFSSICSHAAAVDYFIESITAAAKCRFWGKPWKLFGNRTESDACPGKKCELTPMGYECNKFAGRGTFYVPVADGSPHCAVSNNRG
ncbi:pancreatic lipase-related protein 2-like isoform X2 [Neocloeon triangulifer]|uniref:pancreatic lipase-related protein 2-like isoform X2 n=1 Tax=Neocloeon triangulifer TaxID=2078957 RepID=UPI00286F0DBE|nr:pancreatic lipase-related protein 2-like isoform X2 [Neocloeon triangulifer]